MPLSHIGLVVPRSKFEQTVSFYLSALEPLGYKEHARPVPHVVGLGVMYPDFWISTICETMAGTTADEEGKKAPPVHVAFTAGNRNLVHAFYAAALKAGGKCNGPPGPRPQYTRTYYAAFVIDPAGNNIETVCIWPAWTHLGYWLGKGEAFSKQQKAVGSGESSNCSSEVK
ncbi:hypothetical protein VTO42DRAFT_368 [Malbranchea cinnamomea]